MADTMGRSGMFGVKTAEQAVVILMTGLEMGLAPAQAMRGIQVVQGRPSPSADTLIAVCLSHPSVCKYFVPLESSADHATYETLRAGNPKPTPYTFTMDMARRAKLDNKETWKQHPEAMLRARCITHLAKMIYPDLTLGLYTPDEAEEMEPLPAASKPVPTPKPAPVNVTPPQERGERQARHPERPATQSPRPAPQNNAPQNNAPQNNAPQNNAPQNNAPQPVAKAPETIQERRNRLRELVQSLPDGDTETVLAEFQAVFGRNDYGSFDLDQCRRAIKALESGAAIEMEAGVIESSEAEPDPFDDANGFKSQQPPLMETDVDAQAKNAQKGHGES